MLCRFSGAVNQTLLTFFGKNLEEVVGPLKGSPWAYLSSSADAYAGTPEVETLLVSAAKKGYEWGCVQGAYVLTSPVAIAQTRKIRDEIGVFQPLEEVLFDTEEQAIEFLNDVIAKTNAGCN